jgi:hypothetical protein
VSMWLLKKGKNYLFALIPGIFMAVTTIASLIYILVTSYWPGKNIMLSIGDIALIVLAVGVILLVGRFYKGINEEKKIMNSSK